MLCDCHSVTKEVVVTFKILRIVSKDEEFQKKKKMLFTVLK